MKRPLTTKTAPALHNLFLCQDPPFPIPLSLIGSSQLWVKHFPYLYPSTPILVITSTLYAYEDGKDRKFRNVGTKGSDAGRLHKRHNTACMCQLITQDNLFFDIMPCNVQEYCCLHLCRWKRLGMSIHLPTKNAIPAFVRRFNIRGRNIFYTGRNTERASCLWASSNRFSVGKRQFDQLSVRMVYL